jgi:hypothetical protein
MMVDGLVNAMPYGELLAAGVVGLLAMGILSNT